ncbi:deoxyribose-phosphate aldolase [candidate division WOR-3 bacterium]|nr:deoxyribose-phosphate aldolase [candidate division WOR-3 bacterium]
MLSKSQINLIINNCKKIPEIDSTCDLRPYIEHTCLGSETTEEKIVKTAKEALENKFHGICVPPSKLSFAKNLIEGSDLKLVTVISFPLGYSTTIIKTAEASNAIDCGADEIDMVIDIGSALEGNYNRIQREISAVASVLRENTPLKAIIETALMNQEQIITLCYLAALSGASFVKTSTGFSSRGASVEDVLLLKSTSDFVQENYGLKLGIKASGGIKEKIQAQKLIAAGADRIGSSKSLHLL